MSQYRTNYSYLSSNTNNHYSNNNSNNSDSRFRQRDTNNNNTSQQRQPYNSGQSDRWACPFCSHQNFANTKLCWKCKNRPDFLETFVDQHDDDDDGDQKNGTNSNNNMLSLSQQQQQVVRNSINNNNNNKQIHNIALNNRTALRALVEKNALTEHQLEIRDHSRRFGDLVVGAESSPVKHFGITKVIAAAGSGKTTTSKILALHVAVNEKKICSYVPYNSSTNKTIVNWQNSDEFANRDDDDDGTFNHKNNKPSVSSSSSAQQQQHHHHHHQHDHHPANSPPLVCMRSFTLDAIAFHAAKYVGKFIQFSEKELDVLKDLSDWKKRCNLDTKALDKDIQVYTSAWKDSNNLPRPGTEASYARTRAMLDFLWHKEYLSLLAQGVIAEKNEPQQQHNNNDGTTSSLLLTSPQASPFFVAWQKIRDFEYERQLWKHFGEPQHKHNPNAGTVFTFRGCNVIELLEKNATEYCYTDVPLKNLNYEHVRCSLRGEFNYSPIDMEKLLHKAGIPVSEDKALATDAAAAAAGGAARVVEGNNNKNTKKKPKRVVVNWTGRRPRWAVVKDWKECANYEEREEFRAFNFRFAKSCSLCLSHHHSIAACMQKFFELKTSQPQPIPPGELAAANQYWQQRHQTLTRISRWGAGEFIELAHVNNHSNNNNNNNGASIEPQWTTFSYPYTPPFEYCQKWVQLSLDALRVLTTKLGYSTCVDFYQQGSIASSSWYYGAKFAPQPTSSTYVSPARSAHLSAAPSPNKNATDFNNNSNSQQQQPPPPKPPLFSSASNSNNNTMSQKNNNNNNNIWLRRPPRPDEVHFHEDPSQILESAAVASRGNNIMRAICILPDFPFGTKGKFYKNCFERHCPIIVDEAQDYNACNLSLLTNVAYLNDCQLYLVGDPMQSIYKFRGSTSELFVNPANLKALDFDTLEEITGDSYDRDKFSNNNNNITANTYLGQIKRKEYCSNALSQLVCEKTLPVSFRFGLEVANVSNFIAEVLNHLSFKPSKKGKEDSNPDEPPLQQNNNTNVNPGTFQSAKTALLQQQNSMNNNIDDKDGESFSISVTQMANDGVFGTQISLTQVDQYRQQLSNNKTKNKNNSSKSLPLYVFRNSNNDPSESSSHNLASSSSSSSSSIRQVMSLVSKKTRISQYSLIDDVAITMSVWSDGSRDLPLVATIKKCFLSNDANNENNNNNNNNNTNNNRSSHQQQTLYCTFIARANQTHLRQALILAMCNYKQVVRGDNRDKINVYANNLTGDLIGNIKQMLWFCLTFLAKIFGSREAAAGVAELFDSPTNYMKSFHERAKLNKIYPKGYPDLLKDYYLACEIKNKKNEREEGMGSGEGPVNDFFGEEDSGSSSSALVQDPEFLQRFEDDDEGELASERKSILNTYHEAISLIEALTTDNHNASWRCFTDDTKPNETSEQDSSSTMMMMTGLFTNDKPLLERFKDARDTWAQNKKVEFETKMNSYKTVLDGMKTIFPGSSFPSEETSNKSSHAMSSCTSSSSSSSMLSTTTHHRGPVHNQTTINILFTSTHQVKGQEYDNIILADDFTPLIIPNGFCRERHDYLWQIWKKSSTMRDEFNILYVAITRAKKHAVMPHNMWFWSQFIPLHPLHSLPYAGIDPAWKKRAASLLPSRTSADVPPQHQNSNNTINAALFSQQQRQTQQQQQQNHQMMANDNKKINEGDDDAAFMNEETLLVAPDVNCSDDDELPKVKKEEIQDHDDGKEMSVCTDSAISTSSRLPEVKLEFFVGMHSNDHDDYDDGDGESEIKKSNNNNNNSELSLARSILSNEEIRTDADFEKILFALDKFIHGDSCGSSSPSAVDINVHQLLPLVNAKLELSRQQETLRQRCVANKFAFQKKLDDAISKVPSPAQRPSANLRTNNAREAGFEQDDEDVVDVFRAHQVLRGLAFDAAHPGFRSAIRQSRNNNNNNSTQDESLEIQLLRAQKAKREVWGYTNTAGCCGWCAAGIDCAENETAIFNMDIENLRLKMLETLRNQNKDALAPIRSKVKEFERMIEIAKTNNGSCGNSSNAFQEYTLLKQTAENVEKRVALWLCEIHEALFICCNPPKTKE